MDEARELVCCGEDYSGLSRTHMGMEIECLQLTMIVKRLRMMDEWMALSNCLHHRHRDAVIDLPCEIYGIAFGWMDRL